ncbi:MAG: 30S ribosomal protein S6 [Acidiferrobacteraceae bacterium]|jgi:small subunit ribosomal protein S6|nr:30S ribosomal protein S6 [Acidiferrobacteraceae bacterium]
MRHYEIIFLVHPDQSENVGAMVERYRKLVEDTKGTVHRVEDWGRRQLAYPIEKIHKAHYVLMNIECDQPSIDELKSMFKFSDAVIRNIVIRTSKAIIDPSPLARSGEEARENELREARESEAAREAAERVDDTVPGETSEVAGHEVSERVDEAVSEETSAAAASDVTIVESPVASNAVEVTESEVEKPGLSGPDGSAEMATESGDSVSSDTDLDTVSESDDISRGES